MRNKPCEYGECYHEGKVHAAIGRTSYGYACACCIANNHDAEAMGIDEKDVKTCGKVRVHATEEVKQAE